MSIFLDTSALRMLALFEQVTGVGARDFFEADKLVFVVDENKIGAAVGRNGVHVRSLERQLKKSVKIVSFSPDVLVFAENLVAPLELADAAVEEGVVFLSAKDLKTRGLLIGRGASNLHFFEAILKRHFKIHELRVV